MNATEGIHVHNFSITRAFLKLTNNMIYKTNCNQFRVIAVAIYMQILSRIDSLKFCLSCFATFLSRHNNQQYWEFNKRNRIRGFPDVPFSPTHIHATCISFYKNCSPLIVKFNLELSKHARLRSGTCLFSKHAKYNFREGVLEYGLAL